MKVRVAELMTSCAHASQFPPPELPEIAFLGRSNVGKSSLLNALVQRKKLARTSGTPGKTRLIHFFKVQVGSTDLVLVDLPGYGWAKVSRKERDGWQRLVESYLESRPVLRAALLLQDLRRDPTEDETLLLDWLAEREVPRMVVLTKIDKLKQMRRQQRIKTLRKGLDAPGARILATSSQSRAGIDELWKAIFSLVNEPPADDSPGST
jgi:GTP-binding protein